MKKAFFSKNSPYISSILNLDDPNLMEEFDRLDDVLKESGLTEESFDIPIILPLFEHIKMEERRIGLMLELCGFRGNFGCEIRLPLYYVEHNFFLTDEEKDKIADEPLFQTISRLCEGGKDELEAFLKEHLVNDKFGLGDLRATFLWDVGDIDCAELVVGVELTIPTATTFINGIVGGKYERDPCQPVFNLTHYIEALFEGEIQDSLDAILDLGIEALDRLTRVAAETELGCLHFGIGPILEFKLAGCNSTSWTNRIRAHLYAPRNVTRFMREHKNTNDFLGRDYEDEDQCTENIAFLSEKFVAFFYPYPIRTKVYPGAEFQFTTSIDKQYDCYHLEIGYDFWTKAREKLCIEKKCNNLGIDLDLANAIRPTATQQKIFSRLYWSKKHRCYVAHLGISGDYPPISSGIGRDWTVALDFKITF